MNRLSTAIPDVVRLQPKVFADPRGQFFESWNRHTFAGLGLDVDFVQDNQSHSIRGTLRGLHYQNPHAQGKLVRVVTGRVFDVAVDLRRSSPTFRQWVGVELDSERHEMLWIPPGFAHGFYVSSTTADIVYKCSGNLYTPQSEWVLRWDDPKIGVDWPLVGGGPPSLSAKDAAGMDLSQVELFD